MRDLVYIDETEVDGGDANEINGLGPEDFLLMTDLLAIIQNSYGGIKYIEKPLLGLQPIPNGVHAAGSAYTTTEYWEGPHLSSKLEFATDVGFTNIVHTETKNSGNLTDFTVTGVLAPGTYYARLKYFSDGEVSIWSNFEEVTVA